MPKKYRPKVFYSNEKVSRMIDSEYCYRTDGYDSLVKLKDGSYGIGWSEDLNIYDPSYSMSVYKKLCDTLKHWRDILIEDLINKGYDQSYSHEEAVRIADQRIEKICSSLGG